MWIQSGSGKFTRVFFKGHTATLETYVSKNFLYVANIQLYNMFIFFHKMFFFDVHFLHIMYNSVCFLCSL